MWRHTWVAKGYKSYEEGCSRGMTGRRASRLPSLKVSAANNGPAPSQPLPSPSPNTLGTGPNRSRRASISSNDSSSLGNGGSLGRDGSLSDFAFVEQLEDFRRQLLDLRKEKKKLEDEIIKYKLLCKDKHNSIQELHNKLEAEKANMYELRDQLTRDLTLQYSNQHASEKKKLNFEVSILKNDKRKLESDIRLLETTNKGLFEEIRQIRSQYDAKMEKLMKDFHIEIYKESGEKRRLERKLADTNEKLTKEEYFARQLEYEKEKAEESAMDSMKRKSKGTFGSETNSLDRQNKKIAELEDTIRKLESLKTISENQNVELLKKLKELQAGTDKYKSLQRKNKELNDKLKKEQSPKVSPESESKFSHNQKESKINKFKKSFKDKLDNADKKIKAKEADGQSAAKDTGSLLKLANKERLLLERKIALLEQVKRSKGDADGKVDEQLTALQEEKEKLLLTIAEKERELSSMGDDSWRARLEDLEDDEDMEKQTPQAVRKVPGTPRMTPQTPRKTPQGPKKKMPAKPSATGLQIPKAGKGAKSPKMGRKSRGASPVPSLTECTEEVVKVETTDSTMQTDTVSTNDVELQVEFYDEEEEEQYNDSFQMPGESFGGGNNFMFQEPEPEVQQQQQQPDPIFSTHNMKDSLTQEYEEKISELELAREKDYEKIVALSETLEHLKMELTSLKQNNGVYKSEVEDRTARLNESMSEIEKLNDKISDLTAKNEDLLEQDDHQQLDGIDQTLTLNQTKAELERLTKDLREKQLTVMKLHQELHEASEELMDANSTVKRLEAMVENLKHDNELMRDEQMQSESTNEEVLDKLRTFQVRCNQMEEINRSLEAEIESNKRDSNRITSENLQLTGEKERFEVEAEDCRHKIMARERELESLLSERPDSNNNETLDLLTEMRQKDNTIKKIKDSHNKTLETLKKEVERQVNALQSRLSRKDDEIATMKAQNKAQHEGLLTQIQTQDQLIEGLREEVDEANRMAEERIALAEYSAQSVAPQQQDGELNKRLAELANENMTLRDQMTDYMKLMKEKRGGAFASELGARIKTQRPSFGSKPNSEDGFDFNSVLNSTPKINFSDSDKSAEYNEEDEDDDDEDFSDISVALVLYGYDPSTMSPNEYPEDELSLSAGEFVYIFGEPDIDGFYTAELMSGQRGLVPSNFIQIVDLDEKKTQQMRRISLANAPSHANIMVSAPTSNYEANPPSQIEVNMIGSRTIELTWEPPVGFIPILGYRIFLNAQEFKCTDTAECRTILKDIPATKPLFITAKTITHHGESSESEPHIHGREPLRAPKSLEVTNISTSSAVITFVGSPHYYHAVFLNGEEKAVLKAGEGLYQLKGLEGDTEYEVRIAALPSYTSASLEGTTMSANCQTTTFLTEIGGPPDPPSALFVIPLQNKSLSISWTTNLASSTHHITSYTIYLNNEPVSSIPVYQNQVTLPPDMLSGSDKQSVFITATNDKGESEPSEQLDFSISKVFSSHKRRNSDSDSVVQRNGKRHLYRSSTLNCGATAVNGWGPQSSIDSESDEQINHVEDVNDLLNLSERPCNFRKIMVVVRPHQVTPDIQLQVGEILIVDDTGEGYVVEIDCVLHPVPENILQLVPQQKQVVALYEYCPHTMSPNNDCEKELEFKTGDIITIFGGKDEDGFYEGVLGEEQGLVPSNFIIDLDAVIGFATDNQNNLSC